MVEVVEKKKAEDKAVTGGPVMKAAVTDAEGSVTIVDDRPQSAPGPGQVRIHVDAAGICGSDLHQLQMCIPGVVPGHEFTGTVVELGPSVTGFAIGDRLCALPCHSCGKCARCLAGDPINCKSVAYFGTPEIPGLAAGGPDGAFAEFAVVDAHSALKVPDSVTREQAGTVEPMSISLKIFDEAEVGVGETVLVLGGGPIGLGVVQWARVGGVGQIVVSEPVASRRELALKLGATHVVDPTAESLGEYFDRVFGGPPTVVVECVGRPGSFADAVDVVGLEGRVVIAGMHMHKEEFTRLGPFLKNVTVRFCCWYTTAHYRRTLQILADGRLDSTPMVTHRISLDGLPATFDALKTPNEYGKVLVLID